MIRGCELLRSRGWVRLVIGCGLANGGMMLVNVAGATCTAPACAVAVIVDVVVVAGANRTAFALRSIASMTFSINSGRRAVRAARTMSTTCVAMSVM